MKVEVLTGGEFRDVVSHLHIDAKRTYRCPHDPYNDHPYYEVWEVEKSDLSNIESFCMTEEIFCCYSNGEHRGTAYDFLTINGVGVIAWQENCKKDTFNCLTDYFRDCLKVTDSNKIGAYSVYLAKTNGWSLSDMWRKLEG